MSLYQVVKAWSRVQPERCAIYCDGQETTWRRLVNRVDRAAARLQCEWGVQAGARVAYLGANRPDELILLFALERLGAILVPLNTRLAPAEWQSILAHSQAGLLIGDASLGEQAQHLARDCSVSFRDLESLIATRCPGQPVIVDHDGTTPVLLVYTSGTTGSPKGALHSQDGLLWNAHASIAAHDMTSQDHILTVLPMFHVGGLCIQTLPALIAGATMTLHPRFDAGAWLADVVGRQPTLSLMVPATMRAVIDHADWPRADLSSLRMIMAGSSTIAINLLARFHERGIPVGQIYGATETGPVSIVLRAGDAMRKAGFAGWPALYSDIRLVNGDGHDVVPGEVGEIWVKGRNVMCGYWADERPQVFADGWFHTGDLARCDRDGCFEVVGRAKDMIISGGENIYPAEIEAVLAGHAHIQEAAVVGVPDGRWGEIPIAAVVVRPGKVLDAQGVLSMFEGRLARFKHPKHVLFVESLPKNALGKIQKHELATAIAAKITQAR